jgi:hypothetical protein
MDFILEENNIGRSFDTLSATESTIMKMLSLLFGFGLLTFVSAATILPSSKSVTDEHTEWIAKSLKEIETVKVGMTRGDLLKVFSEEGGLSTRTWRRYVYRECPYIKVDVEFQPVGEPAKPTQNPQDKIIKISRPFLEWSILD